MAKAQPKAAKTAVKQALNVAAKSGGSLKTLKIKMKFDAPKAKTQKIQKAKKSGNKNKKSK